jgi:uncharacterized protein YqhQ
METIGGQAVIEGVMMRAPRSLAIAVRRPDGQLVVQKERIARWDQKWPWLRWPVFRGTLALFEALVHGIRALNFSAQQALEEGEKEMSSWALLGTLLLALAIGFGLFVVLPHFLSAWIGQNQSFPFEIRSFSFHALDGVIKIFFFLAYIWAISRLKDIQRIFQYHGAEHKAIFTHEAGEDLLVENARKYPTLHPRCGTSFLLLVLLVSIIFFSLVLPLIPRPAKLPHVVYVLVKILLMLPIAGLSYELIKWSSRKTGSRAVKLLISPGLWLQKMTTNEPTDDQIETALEALKQVLALEKSQDPRQEVL